MGANTWFTIAIVGFSLSGVAFIVAVALFIRLNIPAVIGDLTGRTVAREIKAIRDANKSSGDKRYRHSSVNLKRGLLTTKVAKTGSNNMALAHNSKRLDKPSKPVFEEDSKEKNKTAEFSDNIELRPSQIGNEQTEFIGNNIADVDNENATERLIENSTEVIESNASDFLPDDTDALPTETTVLSVTEQLNENKPKPVAFKIKHEEVVVHSDEVIE